MVTKIAGHSTIRKETLTSRGVLATNWLINKGHFSSDKRVLEVACNMCTTSIELAQKYNCHIEGVDLNKTALEKVNKMFRNAI